MHVSSPNEEVSDMVVEKCDKFPVWLSFRSGHGVSYIYDDVTGLIVPGSGELVEKVRLTEEKKRSREERLSKDEIRIEELMEYYGSFYRKKGARLFGDKCLKGDVLPAILASPSFQMHLIVTENCNMRCRYCSFSGDHPYSRTHRELRMPFEIARLAIEFWATIANLRDEANPASSPLLSFYGGEPLLNFELIRMAVRYARRMRPDCRLSLTTNGTLLNDRIIEFLVSHEVYVAFSLDGPEYLHDENRVYINNKGTFKKVYSNIRQYVESRRDKVGEKEYRAPIICCINRTTDILRLRDFFEENKNIMRLARIQNVNVLGTNYYDSYNSSELRKAEDTMRVLLQLALHNGERTEVMRTIVNSILAPVSDRPMLSEMPRGGACIPGSRIAVTPDGRFHMCEKINQHYPIGDVSQGLRYDWIAGYINSFVRARQKRCKDCAFTRLCQVCFAHWAEGGSGHFAIDDRWCQQSKQSLLFGLQWLQTALEEGADWWSS